MANWETKVYIADLHQKYENDEISISEVGRQLAKRLKENKYAEDLWQEIDDLEMLDDNSLIEDYDYILNNLYDFGDYNHRIWFKFDLID